MRGTERLVAVIVIVVAALLLQVTVFPHFAWSGVVPRPLNGSSTTSPRRLYRPMKAWARAAGKLAR